MLHQPSPDHDQDSRPRHFDEQGGPPTMIKMAARVACVFSPAPAPRLVARRPRRARPPRGRRPSPAGHRRRRRRRHAGRSHWLGEKRGRERKEKRKSLFVSLFEGDSGEKIKKKKERKLVKNEK